MPWPTALRGFMPGGQQIESAEEQLRRLQLPEEVAKKRAIFYATSAADGDDEDGVGRDALRDILSGTVAGMAQVAVGHPLDTVRTLMVMDTKKKYSGMMDCVRQTVRARGFWGLYAGAASPLAGAMAHNAVLFFSYGAAKDIVYEFGDTSKPGLTLPEFLLASAMAAVPISFVETPVDLFKIKMQVNTEGYKGIKDAAKQIVTRFGVRGIWQGLGACLLRNIPGFSSYFVGFQATKSAMTPAGQRSSLFANFCAGGVAGLSFWGVWYPFDVVKSRMQADHTDPAKRLYRSSFHCMQQMWAQGGVASFYKGYLPGIIRAVPVNAAVLSAYVSAKRALG